MVEGDAGSGDCYAGFAPADLVLLCGVFGKAFHAPQDVLFTIGVHHFAGTSRPLQPGQRLFTFVH